MSTPRKRVLIVEDQHLVAGHLKHTLEQLGYDVAGSVASGEESVRLAREAHPDLILMDIHLRGPMDGIRAADAIRAERDVPVIYLTGYDDEATIVRAKETSPFGYLLKPFGERELRAAIEVALSKHESDRGLAEERARKQAATELKSFIESVKDYAIFMLDPAGQVATWGEGAMRITGFTSEEVIGKHFAILSPPEDTTSDGPAAALARARAEGRAEVDGWRLRRDGSRFWAEIVLTAVRDAEGRLQGFGTVMRDLTERRRSVEELRESEERLRIFMEHAPAAIAMFDHEMRYLAVSRQWVSEYQIAGDVIGRCHYDVFPELPERWKEAHRRGLAGEIVADDGERFTGAGGAVQWVKWTVVPWRTANGEVGGIMIATEDITRRRESEEALRESEARFRGTFENAAVGIAHLGLDGHWLRVNDRLCAITGYAREELLALRFQDITHADDVETDLGHLRRVLASETPTFSRDKRYLRKDGRTIWVNVTVSLSRKESGEPDYFISVVQDIALRKQAEEALRSAIRLRDEFLQIASHELKTPLTPLQLQLESLGRSFEKSGLRDEHVQDKLERALRQTRRLNRLVESLLDVSRITAGHFALDLEPLELSEVVREVVERFRAEAEQAGSSLTVKAASPIQGRWDRLRLDQMLSNLLSNAIKYGAGRPVEVDVRRSGAVARVAVTDHGIGVPEDALGRIFGRFERAVPVRHFGGLGLGLFIARELAEAHGGAIVARSRASEGSTFSLVLPITPATAPPKPLARDGGAP